MRALDRKLIRDLSNMLGQSLAICLVMACGVATFVMSLSTLHSLEHAQATYYERHLFADVFGNLKRAPRALVPRIQELPGVQTVVARVVTDVTLEVRGMDEPAVGRLIGTPANEMPSLNRFYLREGRLLAPHRDEEVIANEAFVLAHKLKLGDRVSVVLNGRKKSLRIVGVALSPEYIYQIRPGDILPDDRRFGVFWMEERALAAGFDMQGAFNDLALKLAPGANESEIIRRLDLITDSYGGLGAYGRSEQISHKFVTNEIRELKTMAFIAPIIFLSVSAFLMNIVLTRLISTQREQIAALKAFGHTGFEIGGHYLKFVVLIVATGNLIGITAGALLGQSLTSLYTQFFHFPVFTYRLQAVVPASAFGISLISGVMGTFVAVRRAVMLPPAEAMRPAPPGNYRATILERLGFQRFLSPATRMILRNLERQPWKSAMSVLGIAMGAAVLVLGRFTGDSVDELMRFQFRVSHREDLTVIFQEPTSQRASNEIKHISGILHAEPFRSVAARLRYGHRERRLGVMGLSNGADLFRVMERPSRVIKFPMEGLVISKALAQILGVEVGQRVTIEVLEGERPVREVTVTALVNDLEGLSAYMEIHALRRLLREGPTISGVFVSSDPLLATSIFSAIKARPRVAGLTLKSAAIDSFQKTVAENLLRMQLFNIIFASIIAFGVVYNCARIALLERSRELATLRVIGFTRGEISRIFLGELAVLTLIAIPLGFLIGTGFAALSIWANTTEMFRIPLVIRPTTYGFSGLVVLAAALCSGLLVRRELDRLDLVSVLKTRE